MTKEKRRLVVLAILLAAIVGGGALAYARLSAEEMSAAAQDAPKAEGDANAAEAEGPLLADYDANVYTDLGEPILLSAIADGKPLVINFWATWCPYCVQEMPEFKEIVEEYDGRVNFAFVDAADGQRETKEDAQAWLAENGYADLPAYYDTDMAATTAFGVYSFPTTVVVSAEGEILTASPGVIDPDLMRGALNTLL